MSADVSEVIQKLELQLPPLRTLDDFALGSARFQLPNLKDFDKWGNRVVKNLIYYQTNYFLMFITIYGIMIIFNPLKIICGLLVQAMIVAVLLQFFQKKTRIIVNQSAADNQKWYMLAGALLLGYLFLHFSDALLLAGFTLLLPFSLTFVHASLRLRNLKNKVANTMVNLSSSTPMGVFLDTFNIAADSLLN
uniref:PRA1 family protein n=1 Tax=Glossina brevipalpis TaxID=37001 RepID=A0A1A9W5C0_9MUSC